MKRSSYRDRDYAFGQTILTLRTAIGLTQASLAAFLGVSRRAVGEWEAGSSYPKAVHLKKFIELVVQQSVLPVGGEEEAIRNIWKASRQKILIDERWIAGLLSTQITPKTSSQVPITPVVNRKAPTGLPFQPTPFIGRSSELNEIAGILNNPACRLLTLLGPGGVGKTRLSIAVAERQAASFADGIAFVALASVNTSDQLVLAIGDALSLSFAGQRDPVLHLLNFLHQRRMLLVLDNFEHLLEGADLIYDILERAPYVKMLLTSRARLNFQAEWLFNVEGLTYPTPDSSDDEYSLVDLTDYTAVQLFLQRAKQIQPQFPVLKSTLTTIVRVCQNVAGMPLAIELAAAGTRTMPVAEIDRRIRTSLDALSTSMRDVPARHRSMRAVFDHSWNLLTELERKLFSRLAVFRGGFTLIAAEQVAGATLTALKELVDQSLLREDSSTIEPRFILLEPVREYALEKLTILGEIDRLQQAHATYYLKLAEAAMTQWDLPTQDPAINLLNRDLNNIRAALQWTRDGGDVAIGLQLAGVLWRFWRSAGYTTEGREWLEEMLAREDQSSDHAALSARLLAMHVAAWLASDQHDYARATQLFDQSVPLRRLIGGTEADTHMLHNAALQARAIGDYQRATELLEEALERNRALSTGGLGHALYELGFSLYGLALMLREQGDYAQPGILLRESIDFHHNIGDREGVAQALLGLGDIARDQGDAAELRNYTEQSLAIYQEVGTQWAIGFALNNLAQAALLEQDLPQASKYAGDGVSLFRAIQNDGGLAETLVTQGHILIEQGNGLAAQEALKESLRLAWVVGPRLLVVAALEGLAFAMNQPEQSKWVVQILSVTSSLRTQMGTPVRPADQPLLENTLSSARLALGEQNFVALWSAAATQSLEQIAGIIPDLNLPAQMVVEEVIVDPRMNWGDAPSVTSFYGRESELSLLLQWVIEEHCRVISVLGLGGIGKSTLTISLMYQVAKHFDVVIWRSMRDIPICDLLLEDLLQVLAPQALSEVSFERRLNALLDHLRSNRVLLVLDNLESVMEEGGGTGHLRTGYEGLGRFLRRVAETEHQSCILLTSREKPADLVPLEGNRAPVRALRLSHLDLRACEALLAEKGVVGSRAEVSRLIELYAGNPLSLKIVAQTIVDLFDGAITPFLEQGEIIFGGVRELLDQQFNRLSPVEQSVMFWLAILREPSSFDDLIAVFVRPMPRAQILEAIEALHRRSLIDRGQKQGSFTLQSVVLEYITARLVAEISDEVEHGQLVRLVEHGMELAQAREYVRQTQKRLLLQPTLARLHTVYPQQIDLEKHIVALLNQLASWVDISQGYAPANLIALLRLQRGHLRDLDLSRLVLRGAYLQGVEMQGAILSEALIQNCIFTETFDVMTAITISKNGAYWAAASRRGELRVWSESGRVLHRVWRAHTDMIWTLAFSPDDLKLATGSWDGAVKIWDLASGELLWSGWHTSYVNSVAFSPDGEMLASAGNDATLRVWDLQQGTQLHELPHPGPVTGAGVTWSSDGRLLVSGDLEGNIHLWQVNRSEPVVHLLTLTGHTQCVDGLAFSPDSSTLASVSWDNSVKLWEMPSGRLLQTMDGHTDRVVRVIWSFDGQLLASSSRDQTIRLWDVKQGSLQAILQGHTGGVRDMAFTPDMHNLVSVGEDGTLRIWDIETSHCTYVMQGHADSLYDVDWSPDGTQLVSGGTDYVVTMYSVADARSTHLLRGHRGVVLGVGWNPNNRWLASSEWDNTICVWDTYSGERVQVIRHPEDMGNYFHGLAWSPDGRFLAVATYRRGVLVWDVQARVQRWSGRPLPTWVRRIVWNPNGDQIAGGGDDGTIYIWDAVNGALLHQLTGHHGMITSVVWSPDGAMLASAGRGAEGGELFVWDAQSNERIISISEHSTTVQSVAWGWEGVITGGGDGALRCWDVRTGECLWLHEGHQGTIQSLKRNIDGTRLASAGDDGAIMIWDLRTGEHLQTLRRDRPYERMKITGIRGLSELQKSNLRILGAIIND